MKNILTKQAQYAKPVVFLHWLIFLLIALAYLSMEVRGPKGSDSRVLWTGIHLWAGTLVLAAALIQLVWRVRGQRPRAVSQQRVLEWLATLTHVMLGIFIILQPLLGILIINMGGKPVQLPWTNLSFMLVTANPDLRPLVKQAHIWLGNTFYFIIGLHILAALWHHYFKKDRVLRRMSF